MRAPTSHSIDPPHGVAVHAREAGPNVGLEKLLGTETTERSRTTVMNLCCADRQVDGCRGDRSLHFGTENGATNTQ